MRHFAARLCYTRQRVRAASSPFKPPRRLNRHARIATRRLACLAIRDDSLACSAGSKDQPGVCRGTSTTACHLRAGRQPKDPAVSARQSRGDLRSVGISPTMAIYSSTCGRGHLPHGSAVRPRDVRWSAAAAISLPTTRSLLNLEVSPVRINQGGRRGDMTITCRSPIATCCSPQHALCAI